ncbi:Rpp20 subunit of nuclear RNase MRP and P-domain-containing protein [Podospora didyma]|uniref:Rpp20 subunit of nuclear RNase MRP and P-domain-containing protein n=1 Tax=Podospora didyma TaxID=330526 RepID=A0AAE0N6S6_9PEZI|nr:Rpp20 subunit of nuclear RNase MRP and P-domain-containing protein [Podospora didyma]
MNPSVPVALPNRPKNKLPPLPKGARIQKRPLAGPSVTRRLNKSRGNLLRGDRVLPDVDGYNAPPRASHTVVIKIGTHTPFMAVVKRVRKALENGPQTTKGLPLTARIAALGVKRDNNSTSATAAQQPSSSGSVSGSGGFIEDALDDVVLIATGRAISRAVEIGAFFMREKELIVLPRTRTIPAIDDVVMSDEDGEHEDQVRVRNLSCIEVGIRWAAA